MATVTAPVARRPHLPDFELRLPDRVERLPAWVRIGGVVVILMAISLVLRTRALGGQFWEDESITTGIASHPLAQIPGVLRHDGSPPLFYVLLHFWISLFGMSESATHVLPLIFSMATIPVGIWGTWSLFGRRAGLMAGVLFATSTFLTQYGEETRMYSLMGLLGLTATIGFLQAFVMRRRRYLLLFGVSEALMLYTHAWALFYGAGSAVTILVLMRVSDEPRALFRDGVVSLLGAGVLFLPWVPNFLYQASHTAAPWLPKPRFGAPVLVSRQLLGGDRISMAMLFGAVPGFAPLLTRRLRRTQDGTLLLALFLLPFLTLLIAWLVSQVNPAFVTRYFAPVLGAILMLVAWGLSRAGLLGALMLILCCVFVADPFAYAPGYKSDMRDVGGVMGPRLHRGDLVISGQPDQMPLAWYYLPRGLEWSSTIGPVKDPSYMNWVNALPRLEAANPRSVLDPLLASLRVGQQVLFVRPLTEGAQNWEASWTRLVRRRSAQWGAILASDPELKQVATAPNNYRGATVLADSAVLYKKVS